MFVASNLQVIEQLAFNVLPQLSLGANPPDIGRKLIDIHLSLNAFGRDNCLMNDATVCCRGWVLYHDNLKVRLLLILCLLGSLAGATTHMTFGALWLFSDEKFDPSGSHAFIVVLPLFATNIVATSLMAYKMRQYRQQIRVHLDLQKNKQTKVERIPAHLGMLSLVRDVHVPIPFLYTILTNQDKDTTGYKIVANMIPQLSAIYPVIMVLLVSLDRTHLESTVIGISTNTNLDPIHFVGNSTATGPATERSAWGCQSASLTRRAPATPISWWWRRRRTRTRTTAPRSRPSRG
ncbi:hypothetical protein C8J57DRAFT_1605906 [Mycena rebaudengoi]|nr:hypothetical protein C8J57DRAFT_1605906 [Mycena rebaudengoi]